MIYILHWKLLHFWSILILVFRLIFLLISTDWSMKSLDFKGNASELSMVVGSSSNQNDMEVEKPKLEDFLGGNSFPDNNQSLQQGCNSMGGAYDNSPAYMFSNCSLQLPPAASAVSVSDAAGGGGSSNGNSIGLSMIKTWLRSQPGPPQQDSRVVDMVVSGGAASSSVRNAAGNPSNVQSLSLSMSTGSQSSSPLPLMAASASGGGGAESSPSADNKQKTNSSGTALDVQSGSMEVATRKSIDTFGQRTSIYRGVTRFSHSLKSHIESLIYFLSLCLNYFPVLRIHSEIILLIYERGTMTHVSTRIKLSRNRNPRI